MLLALALVAVSFGGILRILGEQHASIRLIATGIVLAFAAPFIEAAATELGSSLHEHGLLMAILVAALLVGAASLKSRPRGGGGERLSLKKRVDHDR